jgi:cell division protein FtsI/penicillin-binding protein 2
MWILTPFFRRAAWLTAQVCLWTALLVVSSAESPHPAFSDAMDRSFAGVQGGAVVVRVSDGKVLAAHNIPLLARRIAAPGSAIKPFTLELLLETGAIDPQTTIACRRTLKISGRILNCSHPPEFVTFQAEQALALSCNYYFVTVAERLKRGELERRFRQLGFDQPSGLLTNEGQGHVNAANSIAERQLLAIGVAGIEVTPLELALGYLRLARIDASSATAAQKVVLNGLRAATDYGLAQNARTEKLSVAGKTGTATDSADPHTHAWFAGFAPAEKPEIVVVVFIERGRGGVEAAGIAHRIFQAYAEQRP